jgi:hypothetical protein
LLTSFYLSSNTLNVHLSWAKFPLHIFITSVNLTDNPDLRSSFCIESGKNQRTYLMVLEYNEIHSATTRALLSYDLPTQLQSQPIKDSIAIYKQKEKGRRIREIKIYVDHDHSLGAAVKRMWREGDSHY